MGLCPTRHPSIIPSPPSLFSFCEIERTKSNVYQCGSVAEVRETNDQTGVSSLDRAVLLHDPQTSGAWGDSKQLQQHLLTVASKQINKYR